MFISRSIIFFHKKTQAYKPVFLQIKLKQFYNYGAGALNCNLPFSFGWQTPLKVTPL